MKLSFIIPIYNEVDLIEAVLERVRAFATVFCMGDYARIGLQCFLFQNLGRAISGAIVHQNELFLYR